MIKIDIGQKIKCARLAKGMTQEQLGELIGVQKSAIAKYESGKVVNIKRSTLQKLAASLDLKGSELIEADPEPVSLASFHAKVLNDPVVMGMLVKFYDLPPESQKVVINLVNSLSAVLNSEKA